MVKSYLAVTAAAGLVLALGASNEAGARGLGGGGPSTTPPGFGSQGGHNGFETFTNGSSTARLPRGWDQGKASWKSGLQGSTPILTTRPPGLSGH